MTPFASRLLPGLAAGLVLAAATDAQAYRVFVSNEKENTITVIDSEKLEVIKTIKEIGRASCRERVYSSV